MNNENLGPAVEPKKVQLIGIKPETFNSLVQYLSEKPYKEVANLLDSLSQALKVDATVN